jgi:hypothetical protein
MCLWLIVGSCDALRESPEWVFLGANEGNEKHHIALQTHSVVGMLLTEGLCTR